MKKICTMFLLCLILIPGLLAIKGNRVKIKIKQTEVKSLSQIGEVDLNAVEKIKGQWLIQDSRFILRFTNRFAGMVDGLKYFHYKRLGTTPRYPYIYTIVKSKKSGNYFFARGYYQDKRLYGSTSKIELKKDQIIVYSEKKPKKIYFKALRVEKEEEKPFEKKR
jgi:hypothetical protein